LYVAVKVAELSAFTSCACAPPSDHDLNIQVFLALVCGEGAERVFFDPWITVLVNGVVACEPFSTNANPPGWC
jgi:hypothetical protein